jgi:hypothetical protein
VVTPLFGTLVRAFPAAQPMADQVAANGAEWAARDVKARAN